MARQGGLGKGLGSLIPSDLTTASSGDNASGGGARLEEISVSAILPNPHQPRLHFDEESLAELAASIMEIGVLQPVLVRPVDGGQYELIAGERRWRAARRANLSTIPAVVRTTDDIGSVERALVENLHRQDLTPLEEAAAYQQLHEDFDLTHEQIAGRVGKSRSAVTNTLRLMSLPPAVQHLLADGRLSAGHAKALLATPDRTLQEQLAREAATEGWSVRMLEDATRGGGARGADEAAADGATDAASGNAAPVSPAGPPPGSKLRPPGLLELERMLAEHLSTKVHVALGRAKGRLTVEFADLEDLERIFYRMTVADD